jgi:hypothetical protein
MAHPLANLIPDSNVFSVPLLPRNAGKANVLESLYSYEVPNRFCGAFFDSDECPDWARRIARYNRADFHDNTPGRLKRYSEIASSLESGEGQSFPTFRHALDAWIAGGRQGVEPYTCNQDYGSCVDACTAEQESALLGWRAARSEFNEEWKYASAWYKYADRGYCSDGWNGAGVAAVARRVGVAFRIKYDLPGGSVDFTDDNKNEQIVARQWCRSGIPAWLKTHTQANHAYEDGAITEFDGTSVADVRAVLNAGGVLQTGGTNTSGGSRPFTIGRVGPHMQTVVGGDDSESFRKFCNDVIGVKPRDNDFPVVFNQTWGAGWSGECADRYWPDWWGTKPQGAWVWWASDLLRYFRGDIWAWLPRVKGFARTTPPPPPPPTPTIPINGTLSAEQVGSIIAIRGTLESQGKFYIVEPDGAGKYRVVPKPVL